MRLAEPGWLLLLILAPLPWLWERRRPRLAWPTLDGFREAPRLGWPLLSPATWILRGASVCCMAVAVARPQVVGGRIRIAGQGVAIVAALDRSSSMNAEDFPSGGKSLSRLEAARRTFLRFVEGRIDDLIGLVTFANYPELASPPTLNHAFVADATRSIRPAGADDDGTNLGDAMVLALDALRRAPPKRKVLVLLTDGHNSPAGYERPPIDPEAAASLARELRITVHTIALGRPRDEAKGAEEGPIHASSPDVKLLGRIAERGGGRMFLASDAEALAGVFREIDRLERSPVRGTIHTRYRDVFLPWAGAAAGLIVLDLALVSGRLRRLP